VARVHVNRWGDGSAHLHLWFLARPYGRLQLRGTFLSLWDEILPSIPEYQWRENLALVAAWLAEFGGRPLAEPPRIDWKAPATLAPDSSPVQSDDEADEDGDEPLERGDPHGEGADGARRMSGPVDSGSGTGGDALDGHAAGDAEVWSWDAAPAGAAAPAEDSTGGWVASLTAGTPVPHSDFASIVEAPGDGDAPDRHEGSASDRDTTAPAPA
jgi:hypothetical protein